MLTRRYIRVKVLESIYAYRKAGGGDYERAAHDMLRAVDRARDLYLLLLTFLKALQRLADQQIALGKKKHLPSALDLNPNMKFVGNHFFNVLKNDAEVAEFERKNPQWSWDLYPQYANRVLKDIRASLAYEAYMAKGVRSISGDLDFISDLFTEFVAADDPLQSFLEDLDLHWYTDQAIANSMVCKTIESSKRKLRLLRVFRDEEERTFMRQLFFETVKGCDEHRAYLTKNFKNWDADRIAEVDFLIMEMAMSEFLRFPDIPERVTLNEYIELADAYSTPKSKIFINGVLDKVLRQLADKIKKSPKGLN